ncbi:SWIM zinc finger family protein [Micromonospora sp. WMMD1102]|uniref:SWIM zinc finger family protein n=1 Tax=Micromonospora sp. WMMD1102 TaxID=3016105 RepID=UPI0024158738|nr:SWIM zinc finger family protein [Micromonospora sp. WMMD1102]MDG4789012.1 SWIM zinc finger family protein [Micromonospora sp. WMMD1102]
MADFREYGRPRRVDGGLRARTARGAIGQSWWSRRFLDVLESFALGTRLTRGRSYARAGQVVSLDVAPGEVTAVVQGSRARPYQVSIRFRPLPERVWSRLETLLAAQALFSARLLAGDVPPELESVFAEAGAPLFPAGVDELTQRCDCPDFAVPCKHLAAAFYLLAEAFDADPFQLLHWRGRDRARLLARLRALRGTGPGDGEHDRLAGRVDADAVDADAVEADAVGPPSVGAGLALADLPGEALAGLLDRFWVAPVPLPDRPPTLATEPDLLLRQLGPPGAAIGGPGLTERLRRGYTRFGAGDPD